MDSEPRKKIAFLYYSPFDLTGYYDILSKHADCLFGIRMLEMNFWQKVAIK